MLRNGSPVRLNEVADVVDSVENDMNAAWMYSDGKMQRAVQMQVMKQPGANTIEVSDAVNAEMYWPWGLSTGDLNADGFEDVFITAGMNYPYRYAINSLPNSSTM